MSKFIFCILLAMASTLAHAQTVIPGVPNVFQAGMPAKADDVNANFLALNSSIQSLASRIDKIEGGAAASDAVGTYSMTQIWSTFDTSNANSAPAYLTISTVIFAANGTGTVTNSFGSAPFTWSVSGNSITASIVPVPLSILAGGGLIAGSFNQLHGSTTTSTMMIMTRK